MPYRGSRHGDEVNNFDGYDQTSPYSGGYDLSLTYGRPLQPSDRICYPVSDHGDVGDDRPHYSSGSQVSAYEVQGPNHQPTYSSPPQPQDFAGRGYNTYGSEGFIGGGGGFTGVSRYESGPGQRPQLHEYGSADHSSGYYVRPQLQEHGSEHRSGYERHEGPLGHGYSGYVRSGEGGLGGQVYGGTEYRRSGDEAGGGHRRHGEYGYEGNLSYDRQNFGVFPEQSRGSWNLGHGEGGSGMYSRSNYVNDGQRTGYINSSYYGGKGEEEYGSSKYGNDSDNDDKKQHHQKHHRHHDHHHHHHHNYAD